MNLTTAIDEFLEHLEIERNRSKGTVVAYRHYLTRFSGWVNRREFQVENITGEQVRKFRLYLNRYLDEYGNPLSLKTQGFHIIALRSFLRYAARRDIATLSADKIDLPKPETAPVQFLEVEELGRLLDAPDVETMAGLRDRALMETLFSTGLRVGELSSLDRTMLNTSNGEMRVIGKGRKERIVFMSERAREWVAAYFGRRGDDNPAAFVGYKGKGAGASPSPKVEANASRLTPRSVDRLIQKYALQAGIVKNITPHTLRHSFATDLLLNGADIRSVQVMLGHASITTTQVYTHVTNQHLREVHERFHGRKLDTVEPSERRPD